jgi:hypothetical protein
MDGIRRMVALPLKDFEIARSAPGLLKEKQDLRQMNKCMKAMASHWDQSPECKDPYVRLAR